MTMEQKLLFLFALVPVFCASTLAQAQDQDQTARWIVVPIPNGIKVEPSPVAQPGVWRLDTRTGALQLCYYNGVGGINCSLIVRPQ